MFVVVVGCGVSGLTSALALRERGHDVEVRARRLPPHTTSNVAAAFWYPYRASPQGLVNRWGAVSFRRFVRLASEPAAGVTMRQAYDFSRVPTPRPWWGDALDSLHRAAPEQCPPSLPHGWRFEAPVIDMRKYLPWLLHRFQAAGGRVVEQHVLDLAEVSADLVVNCSGLGARTLCADPSVIPIRGQVVHVRNPGLERVLLDERDDEGIAYVVPRGDDCVLGGTATMGDEQLEPRAEDTRGILERCARLAPALRDAPVLADVVGLRPGRATVRLERQAGDPVVIHNYGHGGSGVTLSWGCALDVVDLAEGRTPDSGRA